MGRIPRRPLVWFFSTKGGPIVLFLMVTVLIECIHILFVFLFEWSRGWEIRGEVLVLASPDIFFLSLILVPPAIFPLNSLQERSQAVRKALEN